MPRTLLILCALGLVVQADEETAPEKPLVLRQKLRTGQRFTGSNSVSYSVTVSVRQSQKVTSTTESVQRTERFVDEVTRAGSNGVLEIDRSYLRLYTKARDSETDRPSVYQSPLQGREVKIVERRRRRDVKLQGRGAMDPIVRRTVGLELDWRDVFPEDPVRPGDAWDAEAGALGRRLAAYLNCGSRTKMRLRFEEIVERDGSRMAKLYADLTLEGMRDRNLFTKVTLAGDVFFDIRLRRVVQVDLTGNMAVRGATIAVGGSPRIVKGDGPVTVKSTINPAPVEAAASD